MVQQTFAHAAKEEMEGIPGLPGLWPTKAACMLEIELAKRLAAYPEWRSAGVSSDSRRGYAGISMTVVDRGVVAKNLSLTVSYDAEFDVDIRFKMDGSNLRRLAPNEVWKKGSSFQRLCDDAANVVLEAIRFVRASPRPKYYDPGPDFDVC